MTNTTEPTTLDLARELANQLMVTFALAPNKRRGRRVVKDAALYQMLMLALAIEKRLEGEK